MDIANISGYYPIIWYAIYNVTILSILSVKNKSNLLYLISCIEFIGIFIAGIVMFLMQHNLFKLFMCLIWIALIIRSIVKLSYIDIFKPLWSKNFYIILILHILSVISGALFIKTYSKYMIPYILSLSVMLVAYLAFCRNKELPSD